MELDYVDNVNGLNENIVRLFNFDKAEAIQFIDLFIDAILTRQEKLDVSQVDFRTSHSCNLIFGLFKSDEGILSKDNETFFCILTLEGYKNMLELIEPFCIKESKSFRYIYDVDTPTDLLFAPAASR